MALDNAALQATESIRNPTSLRRPSPTTVASGHVQVIYCKPSWTECYLVDHDKEDDADSPRALFRVCRMAARPPDRPLRLAVRRQAGQGLRRRGAVRYILERGSLRAGDADDAKSELAPKHSGDRFIFTRFKKPEH